MYSLSSTISQLSHICHSGLYLRLGTLDMHTVKVQMVFEEKTYKSKNSLIYLVFQSFIIISVTMGIVWDRNTEKSPD